MAGVGGPGLGKEGSHLWRSIGGKGGREGLARAVDADVESGQSLESLEVCAVVHRALGAGVWSGECVQGRHGVGSDLPCPQVPSNVMHLKS